MEDELLESNPKSLNDYVSVLKRRKWAITFTLIPLFCLFVLAAFLLPPTYKAQATILIEEQDVPSTLVQTTVTSYAVQRIEEIKQKIMTNNNVISIAKKFELHSEEEFEKMTRTDIASQFRASVAVAPISAEVIDPRSGRPGQAVIAFNLSFKGKNPNTVHKVTNELVTLFLNENLKERAEQSESTSQFLKSEANSLDLLLKDLEKDIALFKEEHKGSLPELKSYNMGVIDRSQAEVLNIETRLQDLEIRKLNLQSQLSQLSPSAPQVLADGQRVLGTADRLKALKSEYNKKKSLYQEGHPDLVRLKREIETINGSALENQSRSDLATELDQLNKQLESLSLKYAETHPEIASKKAQIADLQQQLIATPKVGIADEIEPDNPSYILIATQLASVESETKSLKTKQKELRLKISTHEDYLSKAPVVEQEYAALLRDYDNARLKYREIKAKLMTADLAKNLEQEQKGERFTLIQPPERPEEAISPNKKVLFALGLVLGIAGGIGMAFVTDFADPRVYGENAIKELLPDDPLVSIPYIKTPQNKKTEQLKLLGLIGGLLLAVIIALILIHNFYKPLDVLWYVVMRKFGLM